MSASEKLKGLVQRLGAEGYRINAEADLADALPQIVAVVKAAENCKEEGPTGYLRALYEALAYLDEALP